MTEEELVDKLIQLGEDLKDGKITWEQHKALVKLVHKALEELRDD